MLSLINVKVLTKYNNINLLKLTEIYYKKKCKTEYDVLIIISLAGPQNKNKQN